MGIAQQLDLGPGSQPVEGRQSAAVGEHQLRCVAADFAGEEGVEK